MRCKKVATAFLFVLTLSLITGQSLAAENNGNGWKSRTLQTRIVAKKELIQGRKQLIEKLMASVVRKKQYELYDSTGLAIQLLGQLRAKEAVELLIDHIDIRFPMIELELAREQSLHFAAQALVDIGNPSIAALIDKISTEKTPSNIQLSAWVLGEILEKDVAVYVLHKAVKKQKNQASKDRINKAIEYLGG